MRRPQGVVFVIPLNPRKLLVPVLALAGLLSVLFLNRSPSAAHFAPLPGDPPPELRLVPPDTFFVAHVNMASLLNKDAAKAFVEMMDKLNNDPARASAEKAFGVPLADVEAFAFLGGMRNGTSVVTTRKPFDSRKVLAALAPKAVENTYKGKVFHVGVSPWMERIDRPPFNEFPKDGPFRDKDRIRDGIKDLKDIKPADRIKDFEIPKDRFKDGKDLRPIEPVKDAVKPPLDQRERGGNKEGDGPRDKDFDKDSAPRDGGKDRDDERPRRLEPYAPAVYFLSERTYVFGVAQHVMHFIDTAAKPDEKSPLMDAFTAAGKHHLTLGFHLPAELSRELKREFSRMRSRDPLATLTHQSLKPMMEFQQVLLTADLADTSRIDATARFPDGRAAGKALESARFALQLVKGSAGMLEEELAKLLGGEEQLKDSKLAALLDAYRAALGEAEVKADGSSVKLSVKMKTDADQIKAALVEAAPKLAIASNRARSANNLKELGLALHNFDSAMGMLPPVSALFKQGKPVGLSWRVQLLPYIEQEPLYRKFRHDEPWDSDHNKKLIKEMPRTFAAPGVKAQGEGMTYYQAVTAEGDDVGQSAFPLLPERRIRIFAIPDGTSDTIGIVEAAEPVVWTKPDDIVYSPKRKMLPLLGGVFADGFHAAFLDGSVRFLRKKDMTEEFVKSAFTTSGAEKLKWPAGYFDEDRGFGSADQKIGLSSYPSKDKDDNRERDKDGRKDATRPADKIFDKKPSDKEPKFDK